MRATSFSRTVEPSVLARRTMSPNCSTVVSWPATTTVALIGWLPAIGRSPIVPDETCAFCERIALLTSIVERLKPTSLAGSIQIRIARSVPKSCAWPTPGMRWISGSTVRDA